MLVFDITLEFYWSKKSQNHGLTAPQATPDPSMQESSQPAAKVSANSRQICIPHCQEHD